MRQRYIIQRQLFERKGVGLMKSLAVAALPVLAALVLVAPTRSAPKPAKVPEKVPEKVKKDLGERTIAILSGATRVEVLRLAKWPAQKPKPPSVGADKLQWSITATGKEKGKPFATKVRALLLDEATRTLSGASGFRGDVAFRLWKEKESVTVVVDFEGSQFLVVARDVKGKQINTAFGGFLFNAKGAFDTGDLFARVKALAVEAFPEDAKIRALKKVEVDFVNPLKPIKP
jgi:hypothetical protein